MKLRKSEVFALVIVLISLAIGIFLYPYLPGEIASHWNIRGQVDEYMPKFWGVFLMPLVSCAMLLIFLIVPKIDPKKENIEKFRKYFDNFIIIIFLFLFYFNFLVILYNLGCRFSIIRLMVPAFAVLFYYAGILISKAEMNWTIGIRTPWTLSSEAVWKKTHRLGGKLFRTGGIIALFGLFFPNQAFWFIIIPIIAAAIIAIACSYLEYKKISGQ